MKRALWVAMLALGIAACEQRQEPLGRALAPATEALADHDFERDVCLRRIADARAEPDLGGAPKIDEARVAFLGRAHGDPVVFVSQPPAPTASEPPGDPGIRMERILKHPTRAARRARLLHGGYVLADDPSFAFELVKRASLPKLFDAQELWLQRGSRVMRLKRVKAHEEPYFAYEYADGPWDKQPAVMLFADRVATDREALAEPLHRDVRTLRDRVGFDRIRVTHRTRGALIAELRFGERWIEALLPSRGAELDLGCMAATRLEKAEAERWVAERAPRERALAALRGAVDALVAERLPFDRPREAEDHLSDGQLRPTWEDAYRRGRAGFGVDKKGYAVFDKSGRPYPPETCVAMVLDAYERASGTWYAPLGQPPQRIVGRLDFEAYDIDNRSGVLGFEKFAERHPELFEHRRIPENERIPFRDREAFFGYLLANAERFAPGDVVAIQGVKSDGNIHQHAIMIDDVDPLTGFASGLVDQMTRPRRRTWEDVMAEAPARALLYHLRPQWEILGRLEGGEKTAPIATDKGG